MRTVATGIRLMKEVDRGQDRGDGRCCSTEHWKEPWQRMRHIVDWYTQWSLDGVGVYIGMS